MYLENFEIRHQKYYGQLGTDTLSQYKVFYFFKLNQNKFFCLFGNFNNFYLVIIDYT